jgi:hypothetical protein
MQAENAMSLFRKANRQRDEQPKQEYTKSLHVD